MDAEFEAANRARRERREREPFARTAVYDSDRQRVIIALSTGAEFSFPPELAEGLSDASPDNLSDIVVSPSGFTISFPKLDADFDLTTLMAGVFGSRRWMAAVLGAKGGKSSSNAKQRRTVKR